MPLLIDSEKKIAFAGLSLISAIVFLVSVIVIFLQVGSLYVPNTNIVNSELNIHETSIFKEKMEDGSITKITISEFKQNLVEIHFEYEDMEDYPHSKEKNKNSKKSENEVNDSNGEVGPTLYMIQKKKKIIQNLNFAIYNPKQIPITRIEFSQYHKKKALPFAIIGGTAFLLCAFFAYRREKVIIRGLSY